MKKLKPLIKLINVLARDDYSAPKSKNLLNIFEELLNVINQQNEKIENLEEKLQYIQREIDDMKAC